MLFSNGASIKNFRVQEEWTLRELYILLFISGLINTPSAD
jgi:hypothetical protein